ncbi:hypothetical protein MPUL_00680 [Mycolicibacterium pulveris]|uniref:Uncharacterized protein n=1 Tax=Mycolicibacterium pulveris TaxID=36813 RepID=A0A7I7UCU7_MYCPV|nr:hypothetical protein MPUL_00680 [Mycolicibacterium pulveris]
MVEHRQPTLAQVVEQHVYSPNTYLCSCSRDDDDAPTISFTEWAVHVAAVWREACTITTAGQLDALPTGAVIRTAGVVYASEPRTGVQANAWVAIGDRYRHCSDEILLPALLIHHPDWSRDE